MTSCLMLLFLATKLRCFSKTLLVISDDDSDAITDDDIRIRYSLNRNCNNSYRRKFTAKFRYCLSLRTENSEIQQTEIQR